MLLLIRIFSVSAPYDFDDPTDDVRHYQNSVLVSTGDFHDEIDITNFNIGTQLAPLGAYLFLFRNAHDRGTHSKHTRR